MGWKAVSDHCVEFCAGISLQCSKRSHRIPQWLELGMSSRIEKCKAKNGGRQGSRLLQKRDELSEPSKT